DEGENNEERADRNEERMGQDLRPHAARFLCMGARQLPHDQEQNESGDRGGAEAACQERRRDSDDGRDHAVLLSVQSVRRNVALYKYIPDGCSFRTSDVRIVNSARLYFLFPFPPPRLTRAATVAATYAPIPIQL